MIGVFSTHDAREYEHDVQELWDDLQKLQRDHEKWDVNGDGRLSGEEMAAGMRASREGDDESLLQKFQGL